MKESRYNVWVESRNTAYVFNGFSGALLRVSCEDREALAKFVSDEKTACSTELLAYLAGGGMLIPEGIEELDLLRRRYSASRHNTSHFALTIVTSLGCNFACPYCFEVKYPSIINEEVQGAVIGILQDKLPALSSFGVTWFGGEPLLGLEPLVRLSETFLCMCSEAGVEYDAALVTNGYLLSEATCTRLKQCKVRQVQISLDGPPEIHDRMRPLVSGKGSFWKIVENLHYAVEHFEVSVRINADKNNFPHAERMLKILSDEGFAGKLLVDPGQIVAIDDGVNSPSVGYGSCCFTSKEFAEAERQFASLVARYGFGGPQLPRPTAAPCTAVRANELVVGSEGELYKCWDSVGNHLEVVGDIRDYRNPMGRLQKWLKYDPFEDAECRNCIALPVCMGGCAHHAMAPPLYENRCSTFRHIHREQVLAYVEAAECRSADEAAPRDDPKVSNEKPVRPV